MFKISVRGALANFLGVIMGMILALFLVMAPLFADTGAVEEYLFSFFLDLVIYGIISTGLAILARRSRAYISLSLPAILVSFGLLLSDGPYPINRTVLFLIYPTIVVVASLLPFLALNAFFNAKSLKDGK